MSAASEEQVFDPGLQPERTFLAWQRTVLALGVAGAVAVRFTAPHFGAIAVLFGLAGLAFALAAYISVRYRYRRTLAALKHTETLHAVGAWPLAALASSALMLGVLAVLFLGGGIQLTL